MRKWGCSDHCQVFQASNSSLVLPDQLWKLLFKIKNFPILKAYVLKRSVIVCTQSCSVLPLSKQPSWFHGAPVFPCSTPRITQCLCHCLQPLTFLTVLACLPLPWGYFSPECWAGTSIHLFNISKEFWNGKQFFDGVMLCGWLCSISGAALSALVLNQAPGCLWAAKLSLVAWGALSSSLNLEITKS